MTLTCEPQSVRRLTVLRPGVEPVLFSTGKPVYNERHPAGSRGRGIPGTGSSTAVPGTDHEPVERIRIRDRALPQVRGHRDVVEPVEVGVVERDVARVEAALARAGHQDAVERLRINCGCQ